MPIKLQPGHFYERRNMDVVKYDRKSKSGFADTYPHIVGGQTYTDTGRFYADGRLSFCDIVKDHGTTDPRKLKKPRKKRVKKLCKVKMYFYRNTGPWEASEDKGFAERQHFPEHGQISPRTISFPLPRPKKKKA